MKEPGEQGWTLTAYVAHNEALRAAEEKFMHERDRRYSEVKAAEKVALTLQAEKDEQHFKDLNHEQARLLADRERYLPRETYTADRKDKVALILAIASLVVALLTLIALMPRGMV